MKRRSYSILLVSLIVFAFCNHAAATAEWTIIPKVSGKTTTILAHDGDTLMEVARREGMGFDMVASTNRHLNPWMLSAGTEIILPGQTIIPVGAMPGLLINLAELRLYHIRSQDDIVSKVDIYPLGIGRAGRETPEGEFRVVVKKESPYWRVPEGLRNNDPTLPEVVPPGPGNPLGSHWLGLSAPGYGVHGTNRPYGVGRRISYGCLRMYPEDIVSLYQQVKVGTPVTISYQPIKAAWQDDTLLLEVHTDYLGRFDDPFQLALSVISRTGWPGEIDYMQVKKLVSEQNNLPEVIGQLLPDK